MTKKPEHGKVDSSPAEKAEKTFEQALAELEIVIRDLEDGRIGLNESLERYEEGVRLLKQCREALDKAERKIVLLTGVDADGNALTEPFDDAAMSLEEKKEARGRRRSRTASVAITTFSETTEPVVRDTGATVEDDAVDRQKGLF